MEISLAKDSIHLILLLELLVGEKAVHRRLTLFYMNYNLKINYYLDLPSSIIILGSMSLMGASCVPCILTISSS